MLRALLGALEAANIGDHLRRLAGAPVAAAVPVGRTGDRVAARSPDQHSGGGRVGPRRVGRGATPAAITARTSG